MRRYFSNALEHLEGAICICLTYRIIHFLGQRRGSADETYVLPLPPSTELIAGSERAYVKVVGDVMGPAMSNIGSLLRMPYGCAEQTMVSFAPNIFALQYLEAVNKDNPTLREKAIRFMKSGELLSHANCKI